MAGRQFSILKQDLSRMISQMTTAWLACFLLIPYMHAIEKSWPGRPEKKSVSTGEIVTAGVDVAEVNDLYLQVVTSFYQLGGTKVKKPEATTFVFDHYAPPHDQGGG
jgi:hypothetical protein